MLKAEKSSAINIMHDQIKNGALFSVQMYLNFGLDGKQYVRRSPNKEYDPRYTKKASWCVDVSHHLLS